MSLPESIEKCTLTGRFLAMVEDSHDEDRTPDQALPSGTVTLTPTIPATGGFPRSVDGDIEIVIPKKLEGKVINGIVCGMDNEPGIEVISKVAEASIPWRAQVVLKDSSNWEMYNQSAALDGLGDSPTYSISARLAGLPQPSGPAPEEPAGPNPLWQETFGAALSAPWALTGSHLPPGARPANAGPDDVIFQAVRPVTIGPGDFRADFTVEAPITIPPDGFFMAQVAISNETEEDSGFAIGAMVTVTPDTAGSSLVTSSHGGSITSMQEFPESAGNFSLRRSGGNVALFHEGVQVGDPVAFMHDIEGAKIMLVVQASSPGGRVASLAFYGAEELAG